MHIDLEPTDGLQNDWKTKRLGYGNSAGSPTLQTIAEVKVEGTFQGGRITTLSSHYLLHARRK